MIEALMSHCRDQDRKSGYMRVYRSHLVRCGWIKESEDMGIFSLMQLELSRLAMCLNNMNASSPDKQTTCGDGVCSADCTKTFTVYYRVFTDEDSFFSCEDLKQLFPKRIPKKTEKCTVDATIDRRFDGNNNLFVNSMKKAKTNEDKASLEAKKPGWRCYCSNCKEDGVDTYYLQWNEPDLSKANHRSKSMRCPKRCKQNPEVKWKTNVSGTFTPGSVWCPTQFKYLDKVN